MLSHHSWQCDLRAGPLAQPSRSPCIQPPFQVCAWPNIVTVRRPAQELYSTDQLFKRCIQSPLQNVHRLYWYWSLQNVCRPSSFPSQIVYSLPPAPHRVVCTVHFKRYIQNPLIPLQRCPLVPFHQSPSKECIQPPLIPFKKGYKSKLMEPALGQAKCPVLCPKSPSKSVQSDLQPLQTGILRGHFRAGQIAYV